MFPGSVNELALPLETSRKIRLARGMVYTVREVGPMVTDSVYSSVLFFEVQFSACLLCRSVYIKIVYCSTVHVRVHCTALKTLNVDSEHVAV